MVNKSSSVILIVEDSPEDFEATMRAFKKSNFASSIFHCEDGDDALDYLYQRRKYSDPETSPQPSLILLDLNLPGTSGKDVLREIKANEKLQKIPVVVLTTSTNEKDIEQCYSCGANSYLCKPVDMNGLFESIQRIKDYWFDIVILPNG